MMNSEVKFQVNAPKVVHETIDGEVVVVNLDKGDYFSLVQVSAEIWDGLIRGFSEGEIISQTLQRYQGDEALISTTIHHFIAELQQEELIVKDSGNQTERPDLSSHSTQLKSTSEKLTFEPPKLQKYTDMEELLALDPIHEVDEQMGWPSVKA